MSIELTKITNCRIMGLHSYRIKEDMPLDQEETREQELPCNDATFGVVGQFVILPRDTLGLRAMCRNFHCRNNQLLGDGNSGWGA